MARIRVLVHGALGKMGQEVLNAVSRDPALEAVAAVDMKATRKEILLSDGSGVPLFSDMEPALQSQRPEVLVDFTVASATMPAARLAAKHRVSLVIGTTGLSESDFSEIGKLCQTQGIGAVVAPNFTIGAVVMMHLSKIASRYFDYAEIIELHHEQKLDAPSGTSLATAKDMLKSRGKDFVHVPATKQTLPGTRGGECGGIAMHSVRLRGMLASQEVIFGAAGQTLTIRHDSINRECYMPGVIMAIKKAAVSKQAVFGLDNLLELQGA